MRISVVLPCFNEAENIETLHERLDAVLSALPGNHEILFVDDGSRDGTPEILEELRRKDSRVSVLEFSRNFGHQAAICAGIDHARGDAVITMDADLQHPPELIPEMIARWREGFEVVYTVRRDPPELSWPKRWTSRAFYRAINLVIREKIPEGAADFRLMDRKVALEFRRLPERTKFLRGLVSWVGFRQCALPYEAAPRNAGASKYNFWRMFRFALDGITSFSAFPLHIATFSGLFISFLSFVYALYVIGIKLFTERAIPGWASVMVAVLFLGGVQLICLGIIGGYLNRVFIEVKHRPTYIIRSARGFFDSERKV